MTVSPSKFSAYAAFARLQSGSASYQALEAVHVFGCDAKGAAALVGIEPRLVVEACTRFNKTIAKANEAARAILSEG